MNEARLRLLLIEHNIADQIEFERSIKNHPFDLKIANSLTRAKEILNSEQFDIVFSEYFLPDGVGTDIITCAQSPVVIITRAGNERIAVETMKKGAADYLIKDASYKYLMHLATTVEQVLSKQRMEEMLKRKNEELIRTQAELEQLELFSFVTSRNVQEPLNKILNYSELIDSDVFDLSEETKKSYLRCIIESVEELRKLLDQLKDLATIVSHDNRFEEVDLNMTVEEVLQSLKVKIEHSQATIKKDPLVRVNANRILMFRLFYNLIENALVFRDSNKKPTIKVTCEISDEMVTMMVQDNGIGFDEKNLKKMFKPFHRVHEPKEYQCKGFGLAICRYILARHLGSIRATSTPGEGSTFYITLPISKE